MGTTEDTSDDGLIRSVSRAFAVVRLMNTAQRWTLHALHVHTGLPKSTLFRILSTLQAEGYVHADPAGGSYMLGAKVRELSAGYSEQSEVVQAGLPVVLRVTREIKWPLAIGVRDGESLVVAYSTMPYSPMAPHTTTVGNRLGLTDTAMGQVYLAHCSQAERSSLLELVALAAGTDAESRLLVWRGQLAQVKRDGHAVRRPGRSGETATLAVPILRGGEAIAALGMTVFGRLMTRRMIDDFLPILQATAAEISANFSQAAAQPAAASSPGTGTR